MKETLYGLTKGGGYKIWQIEVGALPDDSSAVIIVTHGLNGGAATTQLTQIKEGKQGRTAAEQAVNEAKGKIKKQLDKNYRRTIEELTVLPLLPMLAADYRKQGHRVDYEAGVDVSDKLDGLRLLAKCVHSAVAGGKAIELTSRTGQPYSLPHIEAELLKVMQPGDVLDGEAYLHGECLQDITSAVKRTDTQGEIDKLKRQIAKKGPDYRKPPKDGVINPTLAEELENAELIHIIRPQMRFVIFDVPSDKPWHERYNELVMDWMGNRLQIVESFLDVVRYTRVFTEEAMKVLRQDAVSRGYEGVMLRNRNGLYESGKRSADLQKYKEFLEAEFLAIGHTVDKEGNVVFICRNDVNDNPFSVIFGSEEEKAAMLSVIDGFMHKYLKVKFQSRYKKTLLPQFPTGIMFREGQLIDGEFVPDE